MAERSLHAEASLPTVGGTVLALAVIVGLARFEEEYEGLRDQIRNNVHWQLETARFVGHFTLFECYAAVWASVFGIDRPLNAGSEQHTSE